ncbi:hypothetical protein FCM35_KLT21867 [Carex littledalei]|uniref:Uncharacterized protein n=1 Tax=Carex littledalei TaxID=544730 RepID=A0A833QJV4_9POAL|nr:hypothetical protein FCM35_KLT21867 [Carex littledalei]
MAKAKFLLFLTRSLKSSSSSSSKKDVAATAASASNESDTPKIREDVLMLLNNFPESESESDRELSFSFLLSNASPEKDRDNVLERGSKTEDQCKEVAAAKEKKRRKISRSSCSSGSERMGVLLNLPVPDSFIKSRSGRVTHCRSLAELEKREEEFNRVGWWPTLLRRKQDRSKLQLEVVKRLTC